MNTTRGKREKIGRMVEMFAKEANPIEEARAGDIIALVSLQETDTGDTLCDSANPVILERMRFPDPVISVSVKSKTKAEQEKFGAALGKMVRADPSLHLETDRETGQTILRGMGELHLEVTLDRMRTEFDVEGIMGEPQVAYRETFTKKIDEQYIHKKQTGGSGQFAEVWITFEPLERGAGFEFVDETVGGSVPKEYVPAVEKGLKMQKEDGVLAHFPTVDFRATLTDGSYHDVDSNALTFEIAAKACFREAIRKAVADPARAGDEGRNRDAGRLSRRRHRRHQSPSRHDPGSARARHQHRRRGHRAAVGNVRLHRPPARHDQRSRLVHDGVLALRSGAAHGGGCSHRRSGQGEGTGEESVTACCPGSRDSAVANQERIFGSALFSCRSEFIPTFRTSE